MELSDLDFAYPTHLVATEKVSESRVLVTRLFSTQSQDNSRPNPHDLHADFQELGQVRDLLGFFKPGDVLVINNTKVLARRMFSDTGFEILFLRPVAGEDKNAMTYSEYWQVLCPSSQWPKDTKMKLPEAISVSLVARGRTQVVKVERDDINHRSAEILTEEYFLKNADIPLPPYILKARNEKRARLKDFSDYQTHWAKQPGSLAAPTASLHFSRELLTALREYGVMVLEMTLHVGLGTFFANYNES